MVVAFEIKWEDICGLNYHNPLCNDGRLVMEAAKLTKRQFLTVSTHKPCAYCATQTCLKPLADAAQMKEAQKYYLKRMVTQQPQSAQPSKRAALRTYASSPDMSLPWVSRPAQLSRASSQAHHHHDHHVQWGAEGRQQQPLPTAHPTAMLTDLPSTSQSSAQPEAAAPAGGQEAASDPRHAQTPASPSVTHSHTKSCLKHAGVGKLSPPQAREQQPKVAAAATPVAYLQASSSNASSTVSSGQEALCAGLTPVFESAFSDASQVPAEQELRQQSGSNEQSVAEHSMAEEWPETCSWTVPCHMFKYRTVTFNFTDPSLPEVLRPAINVSSKCPDSKACMSWNSLSWPAFADQRLPTSLACG